MTTAITKVSQAALEQIPAHLRQYAGQTQGKEDLGMEDLLIPQLGLAQKNNTPQLDESNELFIEELEPGEFFNSVTNEVYGETVTVIPLFKYKQFIEFKPMEAGGGIVAKYENKADVPAGGLDWVEGVNNGKPKVTEFICWMSLVRSKTGSLEPVVVSFKRGGLKMGKKLGSLIKLLPLPAYGRNYTLTSKQKSKGTLKWFAAVPAPGSYVSAEFFEEATTYFNTLREGGYKVDTRGVADDEPEDEGGDTSFDAPKE